MELGLENKVVLVTAASKGIGRAVAEQALAEGATVIAASRSGVAPVGAHGLVADLEGTDGASLVARVIEQFGRLDALVFNSAGPPLGPVLDHDMAAWDGAYRRLLRSAIEIGLDAARAMRERGEGGSIVFLSSTWLKQPAPNGALSSVLRAGVAALARQMATELGNEGIRINHVMPGATATDRMTAILSSKAAANGTSVEEETAKAVRDIPIGRWGEADEIARAVVFLLSPASGFTTGASLQVDGGSTRATL